ncbi:MAG TPA: response regulator transcription factor [Acetobacteraceae bacterium]|nr:response regulator transcription factor [Acetobacteraceae bacterium]
MARMVPPQVVVVSALESERQMLVFYLETCGLRTAGLPDALGLDEVLARDRPDVLLLDADLTDTDAIALVRTLRAERPRLGLILLSASLDRTIGARALEAGADDWMRRPFDRREVLARLRSVLRRLRPAGGAARPGRVRIGRFVFDAARGELLDAPERPHLADCESALLGAFAANPHRPLEPAFLARAANIPATPDATVVARKVESLRRKLERDPAHPAAIRDIAGIGYMFVPDPE